MFKEKLDPLCSMKRIILYRYHHKFSQNRDLLRFIKYLNPSVQIYGIYGGPFENYSEATAYLNDYLVHNYFIRDKDYLWKWKNGDMTYQMWFNEYGYQVDFDIMHAIEWDLVYFEPLDKLFAEIPENSLALTGLIPLWRIKRKWYWTNDKDKKEEWNQLIGIFKDKYNYSAKPYATNGPGTSLPRIFLEKLKEMNIPELELDEIRIPLYAQKFGLKMVNTNFYRKWFSRKEYKSFNCNNLSIKLENVKNQLSDRNGRRVFHPFREDYTFEQLIDLYQLIPPQASSLKEKLVDAFQNLVRALSPRVQYFDFFYRKSKKSVI